MKINVALVITDTVASIYFPNQKDKRACNTVPESNKRDSNINDIMKNNFTFIMFPS